MSRAAAPDSQAGALAPEVREQRMGWLKRLIDAAYNACVTAGDRVVALKADPDAPVPGPSWAPHWRRTPPPDHAEHLFLVLAAMYRAVVKLGAILQRVQAGGPPKPPPVRRPRAADPDPGLPVVVRLSPPRRRWQLPSLARLMVPGAQAARDRLHRLLLQPEVRALLDAEPEARRALAPVARALGLTKQLRKRRTRAEPVRSARPAAEAPPYEARPVRRRPEPLPRPAAWRHDGVSEDDDPESDDWEDEDREDEDREDEDREDDDREDEDFEPAPPLRRRVAA